ncbi:cytochrome c oxidase subunit 6C-like [Sitodiplosis mosellana]|uniref:cytochrome c oxidase subunit 6C-like n=1 Tax=Sitodiplosis mosellana TaxID=263140 RepID=UPI0024438E4E|nr:cytochrome c oxidase subunit 6C-like [Sitodiplosis mosellana]
MQKIPMGSGAVLESSGGARPLLKGRHHKFMMKHLSLSIAYAVAWVVLVKFAVNDPRQHAYAEYYKNYDIEANFERIRKLGYFQSCPAD